MNWLKSTLAPGLNSTQQGSTQHISHELLALVELIEPKTIRLTLVPNLRPTLEPKIVISGQPWNPNFTPEVKGKIHTKPSPILAPLYMHGYH